MRTEYSVLPIISSVDILSKKKKKNVRPNIVTRMEHGAF